MESNVSKISTCEFETAIVSYLYDELPTAERDSFESHLLGCTPCTDEFAGMSYSRFSVFEWQREEFAPLITPQIVIPYPAKAVEVSGSLGYFSGLREMLNFSWKTAFATVGIFAICLSLGLAVLSSRVQTGQEVSSADEKDLKIKVVSPIVPLPGPISGTKMAEDTIVQSQKNKSIRAAHGNGAVAETRRAKVNRGQRPIPPQINDNVAHQRPESVRRNAPLLSADADDDDGSLRLSDLFEEDGTRL